MTVNIVDLKDKEYTIYQFLKEELNIGNINKANSFKDNNSLQVINDVFKSNISFKHFDKHINKELNSKEFEYTEQYLKANYIKNKQQIINFLKGNWDIQLNSKIQEIDNIIRTEYLQNLITQNATTLVSTLSTLPTPTPGPIPTNLIQALLKIKQLSALLIGNIAEQNTNIQRINSSNSNNIKILIMSLQKIKDLIIILNNVINKSKKVKQKTALFRNEKNKLIQVLEKTKRLIQKLRR